MLGELRDENMVNEGGRQKGNIRAYLYPKEVSTILLQRVETDMVMDFL